MNTQQSINNNKKIIYRNNPLEMFCQSIHLPNLINEEKKMDEYQKLLSIIREICSDCKEWNRVQLNEVKFIPLFGGITNQLMMIEKNNVHTDSDKLIVRLYGKNTEEFINRFMENVLFAALSKQNFSPLFFGTFINGRIEGFLSGKNFEPHEMTIQPNNGNIAKALAQLHGIHVPEIKYLSSLLPREIDQLDISQVAAWKDMSPTEPYQFLWKRFQLFFDLSKDLTFPTEVQQGKYEALRLSSMFQEFHWLKRTIKEIQRQVTEQIASFSDSMDESPEYKVSKDRIRGRAFALQEVLCHNDLLSGNVMLVPLDEYDQFQQQKYCIKIIDYEYSGYNYRAFDLGNHFCGKSFLDNFSSSFMCMYRIYWI